MDKKHRNHYQRDNVGDFRVYILNYKKRIIIIDNDTGENKKSPSHTLFFIPIEAWAVIVPVLFFWVKNYTTENNLQDMTFLKSPSIDDKYIIDFTKIYKNQVHIFKYGILMVTSISPESVATLSRKMADKKKSGAQKDIRQGIADEVDYYSNDITNFTKEALVSLKNSRAILSIHR